jgi:hypothetical protein
LRNDEQQLNQKQIGDSPQEKHQRKRSIRSIKKELKKKEKPTEEID